MSDVLPRISVVTPSYNQGRFIEQTILSVLGQSYGNLEYIIMDGGSSDETVEVIRQYEDKIDHWVSGRDGGQADAINKGFARATGDILCWLNSDDYFTPGALKEAARAFQGGADLIYGDCLTFSQKGKRSVINRPPQHDRKLLGVVDYIVQPSSFWKRSLWEKTGALREDLNFVFDWEWFLRAAEQGTFAKHDFIFSAYRFHDAHKSSQTEGRRAAEIVEVSKRDERAHAHYEFAQKNLEAFRKYRDLTRRLKGRGINGAEEKARWLVPALWNLPKGIDLATLNKCLGMLGV